MLSNLVPCLNWRKLIVEQGHASGKQEKAFNSCRRHFPVGLMGSIEALFERGWVMVQ